MSADEEDSNVPFVTGEEAVDLPEDIDLNSISVEIDFHPSKDVVAVGTLDGPVKIYSYTADKLMSNHKLMTFRHHKESCRAVEFSHSGDYLFTGSADKTIHAIDLDAGAISRRLAVQDGAAIYSLLSIDDYLLASGDDDGLLIVWDFRRELPIMTTRVCDEYISCMKVSSDKRTLLAACGDGSLSVLNLRSRKTEFQSELFNSELLTAAIIKKQNKFVIGSSDGALNIFNWGEWSKCSEKFPCHTGSIDVIVALNDDVLCAGCEDGLIRVVEIHPNRVIGTLGKHEENLPVEGLCISHDDQFLASCSYNKKIKFHSLSNIKNVEFQQNTKPDRKNHKKNASSKSNPFFSSLA